MGKKCRTAGKKCWRGRMAWMAAGRAPGNAAFGGGIMANPSGPEAMLVRVQLKLVGVQLKVEVEGGTHFAQPQASAAPPPSTVRICPHSCIASTTGCGEEALIWMDMGESSIVRWRTHPYRARFIC